MSQEELKDENYKNLLILNESEDWRITLYIYSGFSPLCKIPTSSKIILPKQKCMHRDESVFSFELVAIPKNEKKKKETKKLLGPLKWTKEKLIRITESLKCIQENLQGFANEKRVCLREINREKELATACGESNLYDILGLDMEEIRMMERSAADIEIKRAYHKQIRIWHPDKNFGDWEIALQLIVAKEILLDPARRASYHNAVDYEEGWFFRERWKSILTPEHCTEEQNEAFRRRIFMSVISLGAGVHSLMYTVRKEYIVDGCEWKKWASEAGKGFAIGGISAGIAGVGLAAAGVEIAVQGGKQVTLVGIKQLAGDVVQDLPTKLLNAAVMKTAIEFGKERADDSVENQPVTKHVMRGINALQNIALHGDKQTTKVERLPIEEGPKVDNKEKVKKPVLDSFSERGSKKPHEPEESSSIREELEATSESRSGESCEENRELTADEPKEGTIIYISEGAWITRNICSGDYADGKPQEGTIIYISEGAWIARNICSSDYADGCKESEKSNSTHELADEPQTWTIKYISEGDWISKMIVTFSLNGEESKQEARGNRKRVKIPAGATQIEVRFQVWRPQWGDIIKYDRFKKTWCKPSEPHIFRYKEPVDRTFTLSGSLWYEAVMTVNDEYHEETNEMN